MIEGMADYITSFLPLCATRRGLNSSRTYQIEEFVDGSCRREPDFMHNNPAITGLCRPKFSKRLEPGNRVIYWTNDRGVGGSYLVAILKVIAIRPNHDAAAAWYQENGYAEAPQNLFIDRNVPFPFDHTHCIIRFKRLPTDDATVRKWDAAYRLRAEVNQDVAICEFAFGPNLGWPTENPPLQVSREEKEFIFGRIPNTRNAPELRSGEWERFVERLPYFPPFSRE